MNSIRSILGVSCSDALCLTRMVTLSKAFCVNHSMCQPLNRRKLLWLCIREGGAFKHQLDLALTGPKVYDKPGTVIKCRWDGRT